MVGQTKNKSCQPASEIHQNKKGPDQNGRHLDGRHFQEDFLQVNYSFFLSESGQILFLAVHVTISQQCLTSDKNRYLKQC